MFVLSDLIRFPSPTHEQNLFPAWWNEQVIGCSHRKVEVHDVSSLFKQIDRIISPLMVPITVQISNVVSSFPLVCFSALFDDAK
jgi:hypothetical protein